MKKVTIVSAIAVAMLASCTDKKQQELDNAQALAQATQAELVEAINERDQLLDIINEITATTEEIKGMENIVSINGVGSEVNQKSEISSNLDAIKATLEDRRKRLDELEKQLKNSKTSNSKLMATIESLKTQIANQESEIKSLTEQLSTAQQKITSLGVKVDSLNTQVAQTAEERDKARIEAAKQEALANACYIAIGTKNELKEHNILEGGGFLKKTKIMQGEFDKKFFTMADKRTLTNIPVYSKKCKIISKNQPADSYEIVEVNGEKVIHILNPSEFWGVSNFLVVQVD